VLRYSSGTRVSVTSPKLMWGHLEMMLEDLKEHFTSQLERIIDRHSGQP
jgi:hypothetical protein